MDSLKYKVQKAEVITKAAKKKYYDENEKLNELQARFKAADNIRQEAYTHLQSLRKKLSEKVQSTIFSWKHLQLMAEQIYA